METEAEFQKRLKDPLAEIDVKFLNDDEANIGARMDFGVLLLRQIDRCMRLGSLMSPNGVTDDEGKWVNSVKMLGSMCCPFYDTKFSSNMKLCNDKYQNVLQQTPAQQQNETAMAMIVEFHLKKLNEIMKLLSRRALLPQLEFS